MIIESYSGNGSYKSTIVTIFDYVHYTIREKNILIIKIYHAELYRSLNSMMLTELFISNLYILDNSCFLTGSMSIARFGCGWLSEVGMVLA